MDRTSIAIVGCGGMGRRHLHGWAELRRTGLADFDLVAVCDLNTQNAEDLADEAAGLLGARPRVFADLRAMKAADPGIEAVDICTDAGSHHRVAPVASTWAGTSWSRSRWADHAWLQPDPRGRGA